MGANLVHQYQVGTVPIAMLSAFNPVMQEAITSAMHSPPWEVLIKEAKPLNVVIVCGT